MKLRRIVTIAACLGMPAYLLAHSYGPGPGFAGSPGDSTCAACHGGGRVNAFSGGIALNMTSYAPSSSQHVVITVSDPDARRWGFEAIARFAADNSQAGSYTPSDGNTQTAAGAPGLVYIEHTLTGTRPGTAGPVTFEFDWSAPAGPGDVIFYVAANAADNNGIPDPGDHIYTATFRLAAQVTTQGGPALAAGSPVVNAASFTPGMAPGAWVAIFGSNLAPGSRGWRNDEIVNGVLPTSLDGVSVTVDNKPAAISYISPGQLNVQVPDDSASGSVQIVVTTPAGSIAGAATLQPVSPGFFQYGPPNDRYVAAQHADYSYVGPPGIFTGTTTAPAHPGEVIVLYGTGFGPTSPATPAGQLVTTAAEIDKSQLTVTIGNQPAAVQFAGVTLAGVWQFNVTIPAGVPDGDAAVVAQMAGVRTKDGTSIAIKSQ